MCTKCYQNQEGQEHFWFILTFWHKYRLNVKRYAQVDYWHHTLRKNLFIIIILYDWNVLNYTLYTVVIYVICSIDLPYVMEIIGASTADILFI